MSREEKRDGEKDGDRMKLNKKILKKIILEVLNEAEREGQQTVSTKPLPKDYKALSGGETGLKDVDKLMSRLQPSVKRFLDKIQKVAPAELSQIDDVPELIQTFLGLMDVLSGYNPTDLNKNEKVRTFVTLDMLMPKLRKLLGMRPHEGPETEQSREEVLALARQKQLALKQQQGQQKQTNKAGPPQLTPQAQGVPR